MNFLICSLVALFSLSSFAGDYKDSISIDGDTVSISDSARVDISDVSINKIIMQAASEAVFIDGEQVGYRIFLIDSGSVFETAGFQEGDIVTHIDGIALSTPKAAMSALVYIKGLNKFNYTVVRGGISRIYNVVVSGL